MSSDFKYYLIYALAYGVVLLAGEVLYRILKRDARWSRNFSHLLAGLISLPFPLLFTSHWWVLGLCTQSILFLLITKRLGWIRSHHGSSGNTLGSYLFFVSLYSCFLAFQLLGRIELFVIPILTLSIADVSAAISGRTRIGLATWSASSDKTYRGSLFFFIFSSLIFVACFLWYLPGKTPLLLILAILLGGISTLVEALSPRGSDNLTVPLTILIFLLLS